MYKHSLCSCFSLQAAAEGKPAVVSVRIRRELTLRSELILRSATAERTALTWCKYSHYFNFLGDKDRNNITMKCKLCLEDKRSSAVKRSASHMMKSL